MEILFKGQEYMIITYRSKISFLLGLQHMVSVLKYES